MTAVAFILGFCAGAICMAIIIAMLGSGSGTADALSGEPTRRS